MGESFNSPRIPTAKTTNLPPKNYQKTRRVHKKAQMSNLEKPNQCTPNKLLSRNNHIIDIVPTPMIMSPSPEIPTAPINNQLPTQAQPSPAHSYSLTEVLDDLLIRFILNCPEEEHESMDRLFFQIEEAHWFYEDFYRENCKSLPELKFRDFVEKVFHHCPLLAPYRQLVDSHTKSFYQYKTSVPVCGAIILNKHMNKVLLVKGWSAKSSWSFPRGKINKDEQELTCATREVFEETGFLISHHGANANDFVEMILGDQKVKLFIVTGVSESTVFTPQTRKEISATEWHTFEQIMERSPTTQKTSGKYWAVTPFVRKLKKFIATNKKRLIKNSNGRESPEGMSVSPPRSQLSPQVESMQQQQQQQVHAAVDPFQYQQLAPPQQYQQHMFGYPQQQYQNVYYQQQYYHGGHHHHHVMNQPHHHHHHHFLPSVVGMNQQYPTVDSLLSFSFNMNDIFEDNAVKNVYA
ncbi:mRNA-decapping enzyme subunit 2 [Acrasis kona]|uniref:mRNA-decapping enzyme subunit 2 n=1 Tax=Acrasis kona TaxID=1008807 RepID=A0AAW2YR10_9EUKA